MIPAPTLKILGEVAAEREVQDATWDRRHGYWPATEGEKLAVLVEEIGEVARALQEDRHRLKAELIQVAASAVAWAESIDTEPSSDDR